MTGSPEPPPVVLVVDDDDDVREVTSFALQVLGGFDVREAATGVDALRMMAVQTPDLVLLDVMMPGMDGPAVLRAMRDDPVTASVLVVLLTAKVQVARDPLAAGVAGIVSKPFDPQGLVAEVARVVAGPVTLAPHSSASR